MSYQNISYNLSQEDVVAVKAALETINQKLPFLINLNKDEVQSLFKLGSKSVDFVQDAASAVENFPSILPPSFDKTEYTKDTSLFKSLNEIKLLVDSLSEKIEDTMMAVGSEAMGASLEVYAYVQTASDRTLGLKSVAEKLKDRFKNQGSRKPKPKS
jgi:hypothetical protein